MSHNEILIADAHVEQLQVLLSGLRPGLQVQLVSSQDDAMDMLAQALADPELDTLHVLGHGAPGEVILGGQKLDTAAMPELQRRLHHTADNARTDTQICLWSCRTGADQTGDLFMNAFAQTTNATVFASENLVGHTQKGGTWTLEKSAAPRMGVPFNAEALEAFEGVLGTPTIQITTGTGGAGASTKYTDTGISSTDRISNDVNFVLSGGSGSTGDNKNLYERISTDGGTTFGAWAVKTTAQNDFTVSNASNGVHQYVWQNSLPPVGPVEGSLTLVVDTVAMTATAVDGIIGVTNATDMFMVTLSEAPSRDLTSADFVSTNSSISTFLKIDSTHYSISLTPTANIASGNMTLGIKAGISDIAGNATVSATIGTQAIDTVAPGTPTNLDLAAADDTGSSSTDNITNQTTGLTITGNTEANATVELFNGSVSLGKITANASGVFTTDISLSGSSTGYNITAKATDAAGNASGASLPLTITVDTVAPNAATISTVGGADVFANAVQVTLSGAASDVNATVVKVSDGVTGHAAVNATYNSTTGTWSADITGLNRGALTVTADVADAAGNHALAAKTVYSSIGSAVAAATAGSTVTIAQGTYQDSSFAASSVTGTTTVREIMISKGISIVGLGDGNSANGQEVIINSSAASRAFVVSGDVTSGAVSISGIKVVGGKEAVSVDGADHVTGLGSLTVTNSTFVGQSTTGLMVELEKQGSDLGRLVVQGVVFDQSASAGKSININNNGTNYYEGIRAFGFDGSAVIKDVTVMGASGGVTTNASQYGIHLHGASSNNMGPNGIYGSGPTMGDVTLDNVVVTGGFAKNAVAIYEYANIDGLHGAQGALNISGAKAGWVTVLNVDGIEANYDASKWGVVLGNNMASLQGEDYSGTTLLQAGNVGSQIVGTAGTDIFNGKAGNDVLNGGSGLDVAQVGATSASDVSFGRAAGTNALTVSTSITGTDTLSNVEYVTATNPLTGVTIKTFVIVDAFADTATAIAAAPAGSQLVKAGLLDVSLTDVAAAQAKGLTFYGADNVTVHASAADLLAKGPALVTLQGMGVDSFITTDVVSKAQYDTLVSNAGSANSIVTPSVTITDNQPAVANLAGGDVTYKFTFDQAVTNFSASDVDVTHGTKGALVESTDPGEEGRVFTLTVTPQAGFEGSMSLTVGNASSSQAVDTSAPAAPVVTDDSALTNGYATSTTQTISVDAEAGSAVVVTNAEGAVLASGTADAAGHFSANVTGLSLGDNSLTATATDKAGNTSDVSASLNIHVNNDPVVTGTLSQAAAEGADTFTTSLLANATDADGNNLTVTNVSFTLDGVAVMGTPAGVSISGNSISVNPQDPSFDSLPQGAQRAITVNYSVDDGHGGVVESSETINITGTNDAPVIELGGHTFIENSVITGSLAENVTDADTGDTHTFSLVGEPIEGFTLHSDGSFVIDTNSYDRLADGEKLDIPVTVGVDDGNGGYVTKTVVVTIEGTNDVAAVSSSTTALSEGNDAAALSTSGQLVITDADGGQAAVAPQEVAGTYGTFHVNADGSWTYTGNGAHDELYEGQKVSDSITVTSVDGTATGTIAVNITGTNDAPVLSVIPEGPDNTYVYENQITIGHLTEYTTDLDNGDNHSYALVGDPIPGLTVNPDGSVSVDMNSYDRLAVGEKLEIPVTYSVDDGHGGYATNRVVATVIGTNDAPVATFSAAQAVLEDTSISGQLTSSDLDHGDTATFALVSEPVQGLAINGDGSWTFDASSYDSLAKDETKSITVQYSVTDSQGSSNTNSFVITVTGTNDGAVVSSDSLALTETNTALTTGGQLTITDVDGSATFVEQTAAGQHGVFHIGTDGTWTYTANSANDELNVGQSVSDTFTVSAADGTQTSVSVSINGSNDGAVLSNATVVLSETNAALTTGGTLSISDVDSSATFVEQTATGQNGVFHIGTDGTWTYTANSANDNLNAGGSVSDSFVVSAADGTQTSVSVSINGTNDPAVMSTSVASLTESNTALSTSGVLTISDVDSSATFQPATVAGTYGNLDIAENGTWTYTANSAHNEFAGGQTYSETFTVKASDGTPTTVSVNIAGTNDAAVLSSATVALTETNAVLSTSGVLTISDVDSSATFQPATVAGTYGSLAIGANGAWTYTAATAHNEFVGGQTYSETFTVKASDGTPTTVSVNIAGTNDSAVLSSATVNLTEGSWVMTSSGTLTATDVDSAATFQAGTQTGTYGNLTVNANGAWNYTSRTAHNEFVGNQTYSETFSVKSADGTTTSVVVNIKGTNDNPVVSAVTSTTAAVTEDGGLHAQGQLSATDAENQALTWTTTSYGGKYGSVSVDATGKWSYDLNNTKAQEIGNSSVQEQFNVRATDTQGGYSYRQITINIQGQNDPPVISAAVNSTLGFVAEDGTVATSGQLMATDAEGQALTWSTADYNGSYGSVSVSSAGKWTYNLDNAKAQQLAGGASVTETFNVKVTDSQGGVAVQQITVSIAGTNDGASVTSVAQAVSEADAASALNTSGKVVVTDVDNGQALVVAKDVAGTYGTFHVNADGSWTYTGNGAHNELTAGQKVSDTITVTSLDGTGTGSITVNITGSNDIATVSSASTAVTESNDASSLNASGKLTIADADTGEALVVAQDVKGTYGTFHVNADGSWTYTGNGAQDELAAGQKVSDSITVTSADGTATGSITVNITGSNDIATVSSSTTAVSEGNDASALNASGQLVIADVDAGEALVQPQDVAGTYGTFHVNADGSWTYTGNGAHDELAAGQKVSDSITVTSADGTGTGSITVNITGTNDVATVSSSTAEVKEGNTSLATNSIATPLTNQPIQLTNGLQADGSTLPIEVLGNLPMGSSDRTILTRFEVDPLKTSGGWPSQGATILDYGTLSSYSNVKLHLYRDNVNEHPYASLNSYRKGDLVLDFQVGWVGTNGANLDDGKFHDVAVTYNAQQGVKIIIDGVQVPTYSGANGFVAGAVHTYGSYLSMGIAPESNVLTGQIQEVGIYNKLLSTDQIQSFMQTDTLTSDGLVATVAHTAAPVSVTPVTNIDASALNASGQLVIADADSGEATVVAQDVAGTYGTFHVNADGSWTYTGNGDHNELTAGQKVSDSITVTSADGTGSGTITVNITGTNDLATVSSATTAVTESNLASALNASGKLTIADADAGEALVVAQDVKGTYGTFHVNADGSWTYTGNGAHDELNAGQKVSDSITVTSVDGTATGNITVNITGTNDAAVIIGSSTSAISESNAIQSVTGQLLATDVDNPGNPLPNYSAVINGDTHQYEFLIAKASDGTTGWYQGTSDGMGGWGYTLQSNQLANKTITSVYTLDHTQAVLAATTTADQRLTAVKSEFSSTATLGDFSQVKDATAIVGVNNMVNFLDLKEVNLSNIPDYTSSLPYANEGPFVTYGGRVALPTDRQYFISAHDGTVPGGWAAFDQIGGNQIDLGSWYFDRQVLASVDLTSQFQTFPTTLSGKSLTSFTVQSNLAGSNGYGSFSIDATGKWTYTMNSAHNEFVGGKTYTDSATVTTADGTAQVITVTLNGTDDKSVIVGNSSASLTETNAALSTSGQLTVSDVDNATPAFVVQTNIAGTSGYGSFSVDAAGKWAYTMNGAHNEFALGKTYNDSFTVKTSDGNSQLVTVSIAGTNDLPVFGGVSTASLTETNVVQTATGQMTVTDVDNTATFVAQTSVAGNNGYGKFSMDATGKWTYVMNTAHDEFKGNTTYTDSFNAISADGTTQTVTVNILGANDAAVITPSYNPLTNNLDHPNRPQLLETDAVQSVSGQLSATDVDSDASFVAQNAAGAYGTFKVDASGAWTYVMSTAHDEFKAGTSYTDSFMAKTTDGTSEQILVTITGTNDAAVIGGVNVAVLTETNAIQTATGQLTVTDIDSATTFVAQTAVSGTNGFGKFNLDAGGKWTYTMGTAHNEFVAGQAYTDSFTALSADGTAKVVTVTINGTDDKSVIAGVNTAALTETNAVQTAGGQLTVTDVDGPTPAFVAQTGVIGNNSYGVFNVDASGNWTYKMNTAHDEFVGGKTYTDSVTVTTTDGVSQIVTVTIAGTNDAASIGGVKLGTLTETNAIQTASGQLTITDVDSPATFVAQTVNGINSYGKFSIDASGKWTYTMGTAHDEFAAGKTYTDSFNATSADGTQQLVTVTILGTDDKSTIAGVNTATLTESNAAQTVTGQMLITDVDSVTTMQVQTGVNGSSGYGKFSVDASGKWTYVMNTAHDEFRAGTTYTDSFTSTTSDGISKVVTVSIVGTNDAAVIGGVSTATLTETNAVLTATGVLSSVDQDSAAGFTAQTGVAGTNGFGKFSIDAVGKWTYTMNTAHDEFKAGVAYTDSFSAKSADGTVKLVTVTINGTDDQAVIGGTSTATLTESNAVQTATGTLVAADADSTTLFVAQTAVAGTNGYGKFTVDTAGKWTYTMNTAHDEFAAGKAYTDSITVKTADGASKVVTVTMNGTDDATVIQGVSTAALTETNAIQAATGKLIAVDIDSTTTFVAQTGVKALYGTFNLGTDGTWNYSMGTAHDEFKAGTTYTDSFSAKTATGSSQLVTVTISGSNDAAVITGTSTAALTESNVVQTATGTLAATDIDSAPTFNVQTAVNGSNGYGKFTIDATGKWVYTMNTAHDEFKAGVSYTDSFTATTADGTGKLVTVTIAGTDDKSVIGGVIAMPLTETDAVLTTQGTLLYVDVDGSNYSPFQSQINVLGTGGYGRFSIGTDGKWVYSSTTAHNEFKLGTTYTDSFTAKTADELTQVVTVTITGTNDAAVIGGVTTATLTETNAIQTAAGQLTITDADSSAAFIPQTAVAGSAGYGKFTVDATGKWSYAMNTAHDEFVGGVTYTDKLTVVSADGTTQVLTVNIIGTNDAAVIGGVSTAALVEANAVLPVTGGQLTITDVDNPAAFVAQTAANGSNGYGKFSVDATGKWTYVMNTAHDEFVGGVTYTDSLTVSAVDGTAKVVTVTITGTNDAAVITGVNTAVLTETNVVQTTGGTLLISDVDSAATFVAQTAVNGSNGYGKFTLSANGTWTYTMNTAHDEFKANTVYTDSFNAVSADGTVKLVTVTINGTNDAAVIGGVTTAALTETNAIQTAAGQLTITDVDSTAAFIPQTAVAGSAGYGKFTVDATGKWSYAMNTAHDEFVGGVTYTDKLTVVSADGTTQVLTVNIIGTNDAAVIGGVSTAALVEANAVLPVTGGQLTITDVDNPAAFVAQTAANGSNGYGKFSVDATGKWTYVMNTAHDEFVGGVTYTDSLTVSAVDGTAKVVTVTITGTNDAAVITGINTAVLTETDVVQTTGGTLLISDVDSSATFVAQTGVTGTGGYGKFTLSANGTWTYTMNTAHDEFKANTVYTDSFNAVSADGTVKLVTVTINGTNDAAVIGGVNTATLTETNAAQTVTGQMTITDVDSAVTFVAQTLVNGSNGYGKFTVDATGKWTYVMNNAHDEFKAGVNYTDSLTVVSADGTPKTITVTMVGTNDSAIIGGVNTATLTETDAVQTTGGQLTISDVDNSPPALIAQNNVAGTNGYGSFSIDASGKWTYTMNSAHDEFAAGQTYTDSITVSSEDGTLKVLTVSMIGTNDLAVIGGNYTAALTETSAIQTASGSLSATDVDNNPVASFVAQTGVTGSSGYGTFSVDTSGNWTYAMKTGHDEFVGGTTYTDSFTVKTADGASKVVTVSMLGTDDTSTISGVYTAALAETDTALSTGGKLLSSDIDSPVAAAFVEQTETTGSNGYGSFSIDASGNWTYTMSSAHDEFVKGTTYTDSFTVTTADGTTQVVTVTITGTNDAAVIGGTTVMALTENDAVQTTADAQMSISDVDNSAVFATPSVAGTNGYGSFTLDAAGNWTYTMGTAHNEFVKDVVYTDTATVYAEDGTPQVLTVNITGTDDLSVISGTSAVTITENNDAQVITANVIATDPDNAAGFVPQTDVIGSNGYGSFTLDASGKWVYTMNEAHNEFLPGETYTDSITVTTVDGVTQVVTVTINGADAASTFQGDILEQLSEGDSVASVSGQLTTVDADSDVPAAVVAQVSTGDNGYGTFTVDDTGAWTYTMDGAHNEFVAGTTYTDTTTVTNADGTTQVVTVHIAGTNDDAVITGSSTGSITETNAVQSVSGVLVSTDVDNNSLFTVQTGVTGSNGYGAFSIGSDGKWTYTMNSAHDEFAAGQVYTDSTTVTSIDGTQQVITVSITGSNEAAVITPTISQLMETDATITATGQIEVSDVDNAALMQAGTISGTYGNLTVAEDGSWTYVTNTANNQFVANQTYVDSFTVTSIDGTTGSFKVNILGTNDAAVITGTTKLSLTETNAVQTASADAVATDADGGSGFVARTGLDGDHGYGTFSIDANGRWTYVMNSANNAFVAGQVYTDNVTVSTASGTSLTLTVEITGTNDAAVITANEVVKFEKNTAADLTASGTLEVYDFDNNAQFVGGSFTGDYGTLNLASNGVWTYTASSAHNEFMTNALYTDTFTVTAVDGTTSTVKVNMIGTSDTGDVYSVENTVSIPTTFADNSLTSLTTAGVQQVIGGFDDVGLLVNAREDVVKLDFNLANADFKTSADGHHVEVTFNHDASTLKLLSNVEAVQFNDALVRIIGADGYKDVAEATNAANKSHVNAGDAVFVSVASGYDALLTQPSTADLNNTYNTLTDAYNHHG